MKPLLLFCLIISVFASAPPKIVIDVNRIDKLAVSEISENITAIHLKTSEINSLNVAKVFLVHENIFILQKFQEQGVPSSTFSWFDLAGNFKGKLEAKDPESNELLLITEMFYDETSKSIFLIFKSGYGVCDETGNMKSYHKFNWNYIMIPFSFIFKGEIWFEDVFQNTRTMDVRFVHTDLNFQNKKIFKKLLSLTSDFKGVLPTLNLSSQNNELYVSFKSDNIIYRVNQGKLTPVIQFEIRDRTGSKSDITPNQIMFGKYVKNGYWYNRTEYDFLYNKESNKSYNIKYMHNSDMIYLSGINDDKYNTGYFKFNPTNQEDYIYFIKNPSELKESKLHDPKQANPILFLVKLK